MSLCKLIYFIGSDFYWEFVTGKTIRGDGGPVAIETTLGMGCCLDQLE